MRTNSRKLTHGAMIGAMYVTLCHFQNLLLPGSATWAIQFRAAEALCVLAFFTPAAVPGLTIGCFLFNITFSGALPADMVFGTLATFFTAISMRKLKNHRILGLFMPALFNAILVGLELTLFVGGSFLLNALYVAIGEAAVLLTLGAALCAALKRYRTGRLFS